MRYGRVTVTLSPASLPQRVRAYQLCGYLRFRLANKRFNGLDRPFPYFIAIECIFGTHLVLELREQLGRPLLGGRFQDFLALTDKALQVLALTLGHLLLRGHDAIVP